MIDTHGTLACSMVVSTRTAPSRVPASSASGPVALPGWSTRFTTGSPNVSHSFTWRSVFQAAASVIAPPEMRGSLHSTPTG